jgi:SAM-dependent methyltransferase
MEACGLRNVSAVAGILEEVPLADASVDAAILSNGSFGWNAEVELRELERVTRPGGTTLALAPCNLDNEGIVSRFRDAGYEDFTIEIPVMAKNRPSSRGCDSRPWLRSCRASG